jgi:hypothetical protein
MIANIKISQAAGPGHTPGGGQTPTLNAFIGSKQRDFMARRSSQYRIAAKCQSGAGFAIVEDFSTLVPFSIKEHRTNVVGEQFWGRAARAFVTRKSRNARFIFLNKIHAIPILQLKRT